MKDNPVKFLPKGLVEVLCIVADAVDADIDLPYNGLAGPGQVEGNNIGIIVMLQVGLVDFQQGLIGTKDIIHCNKRLLFLAEKGSDKGFQSATLLKGETAIREMEVNAGGNILVGRHFQKSQKTLGKRN